MLGTIAMNRRQWLQTSGVGLLAAANLGGTSRAADSKRPRVAAVITPDQPQPLGINPGGPRPKR